jgi:hypothetical protein
MDTAIRDRNDFNILIEIKLNKWKLSSLEWLVFLFILSGLNCWCHEYKFTKICYMYRKLLGVLSLWLFIYFEKTKIRSNSLKCIVAYENICFEMKIYTTNERWEAVKSDWANRLYKMNLRLTKMNTNGNRIRLRYRIENNDMFE